MSSNYLKLRINPTHYELMKEEILEYRSQWNDTCVYIEKDMDYLSLPSVKLYLDQLGVTQYITNISHIVIKAGQRLPLHVDDLHRFTWSLTIPFLNIEGTYNRFYRSNKPLERMFDSSNKGPWAVQSCLGYTDMKEVYLIDEVEVDGPMIINTRVPHDVVNRSKLDREAIGVRFNNFFDKSLLTSFQR